MRGSPRERKGNFLSLGDGEVSHGRKSLALQFQLSLQVDRIRSGHRLQESALVADPGHDRSVVESQGQVHLHPYGALDSHDDTYDIDVAISWWHKIEQHRGAG